MEKTNIFKPLYTLNHSKIDAYFSKNSTDFVVREVPLYEFSGDGEHCIIHIEKKDLTTFEAIKILSEFLGIKAKEFGYAGLKDKQGLTTQYISFPYKFANKIENFSHEKMKITDIARHNNKLKIGHLKGNNFFIQLKKVTPLNALKIQEAIKNIEKNGIANYFGYQRFGKFGDNASQGEEILKGNLKFKNKKINDFLLSAYQSDLFNRWLSKRVEISKFVDDFSINEICQFYKIEKNEAKNLKNQKQFFKILNGEILGHYPFGKCFVCENLEQEIARFEKKNITSMGLLLGARGIKPNDFGARIEDEIFKNSYEFSDKLTGSRRFAWIWVEDIKFHYNENLARFSINFYLPKGSYATIVLDEILHNDEIFSGIEI